LKEPHLWLLALLYIGTFGSFIGFSGVFPKLIADQFPSFATIPIGTIAVSLAFLGALVGSLSRPYGGRLADRFGGAKVAAGSFAVMGVVALSVVLTLRLGSFWLFLGCFLLLFAAAGAGNGSTYRMVPVVFALRGSGDAATGGDVSSKRKAAAALGLISAIGAYGGFLIPQALNLSQQATGSYTGAFFVFVLAYIALMVLTALLYGRTRADGFRI
jgi:NNP family nitrate/nitrite transporter-like MFS transporter